MSFAARVSSAAASGVLRVRDSVVNRSTRQRYQHFGASALEEHNAAALHEFRREMRGEGMPLEVVEWATAFVQRAQRERLEHDMPRILRNLAGAALH